MRLITLTTTTILASLMGGSAHAAVINVPADHGSIQQAITASASGDEIVVGPGIWLENLYFEGKAITLRSSDGAATTIIDADGWMSAMTFIQGESNDTIVDGFTIRNGVGTPLDIFGDIYQVGGGLYANFGAAPTIRNCLFEDNTADFGGAAYSIDGSIRFEDCDFENNSADDGGAIFLNGDSLPRVLSCTFTSNSATGVGGAIRVGDEASLLVLTSAFATNYAAVDGGAIDMWGSPISVLQSTFEFNSAGQKGGALNLDGVTPTVSFCTFTSNTAVGEGGAIHLPGGEPDVDFCTFVSNSTDGNGGAVSFTGGGDAYMSGHTFLNNRTNVNGGSGGAMWAYGSATDLLLTSCTFEGNDAWEYGGAIHVSDDAGLIMAGATFTDNESNSGGGAIDATGHEWLFVNQSEFTSNNCSGGAGGAIRMSSGTCCSEIMRTSFVENTARSGGAIRADSQPSLRLLNLLFRDNGAGMFFGGAVRLHDTDAPIRNCAFSGNWASQTGGGLYVSDCTATVDLCSFSGNSASSGGGVKTDNGGNAALANSVVWDNVGGELDGSITATYCNVLGGYAGVGNVDSDPMFLDDDLRIGANSPCRNIGNNALVPDDDYDLDFDQDTSEWHPHDIDYVDRILEGSVDMGAFEYPACPADIDGDGVVGLLDLLELLASWGFCPGCQADIDFDDFVGSTDLLILLGAWGNCPGQ